MTAEPTVPKESAIVEVPSETSIVEVGSETKALVDREMPDETDAIKDETIALIEAIKKRAQTEIQTAGDLTRDAYLTAVRQAREAVEQSDKIIDPERIERSVELIQKEAEKSWLVILSEIESMGTRLSEAAKSAWEALTGSRSN